MQSHLEGLPMPAKLLRKKRHEKTLPLLPVSNVLKFEMVKSMQMVETDGNPLSGPNMLEG